MAVPVWFACVMLLLIAGTCCLLILDEITWIAQWLLRNRTFPVWERIEQTFGGLEVLSFAFLFGFGVLCMEPLHRYGSAMAFFWAGCTVLSVRMFAIIYKEFSGITKWVFALVICAAAAFLCVYLMGMSLDAQQQYLAEFSDKDNDKLKQFIAGHPKPTPYKSSEAQSQTHDTNSDSAIGHLSELGWQIQPGNGNRMQFSDIYKHISLRQSAPYFCLLDKPFNLNIVGAQTLDGLDGLRNAKQLIRFDLTASEVNNISEVRYLHSVQSFVMGQSSGHISDLSPLRDLQNLREVVVGSAAIRDLTPLQDLPNITTLGIGGTQVTDISPLRHLHHLVTLNLGGAPVADLSSLDNEALKELSITGNEIASLLTFPRKDSLKQLSIYDMQQQSQRLIDLSPVAQLSGLETLTLFIFGVQGFDVSPVGQLKTLTKLDIHGDGFQYFSPVRGLQVINQLHSLTSLNLFGIQLTDLNFISDLRKLKEISVVNAPLTNISALGRIGTLTDVSLIGTAVVDVSPLLDLPGLNTLAISRTPARSDVVGELEHRGVKIQK